MYSKNQNSYQHQLISNSYQLKAYFTKKNIYRNTNCFLAIFLFAVFLHAGTMGTYYVSPTGSGSTFSESQPGSLSSVKDMMRTVNKNMTGDIVVFLRGGTYLFSTPLLFNTSDGGTNGYNIIYKAYPGEKPIFSGGRTITGWQVHSGRIFKTTLNRSNKLRTLYVNGVRALMTEKKLTGQGGYGTFKVAGTETWAETGGSSFDGISFDSSEVKQYANADDIELYQKETWNMNIPRISSGSFLKT